MSVADALDRIRREGVGERVIYFFAVDPEEQLVGVLPTRRLLTAPLENALEEIMVRRVVAIPASATRAGSMRIFCSLQVFRFSGGRPGSGASSASSMSVCSPKKCWKPANAKRAASAVATERRCVRSARFSARADSRRIAVARFSLSLSLAARDRCGRHGLRVPGRRF